MDYIRNSKNRKLKTQILTFFSRIQFGTYRFGKSAKAIMCVNFILLLSLFFPWLHFQSDNTVVHYWAFSIYAGGIGYGILIAYICISFFLLSHQKKETLRAYVPFRLSDAQAIVFLSGMLLVSVVHTIIVSFAYGRLTSQEVIPGLGLELGFGSILLLLLFSYFFSQSEKSKTIDMRYFDKKESSYMDEYSMLLQHPNGVSTNNSDDTNMTLPI